MKNDAKWLGESAVNPTSCQVCVQLVLSQYLETGGFVTRKLMLVTLSS